MMFSKRRLHKYIALIQSELFFFFIPQNIFLLQKSKTNLAIRLADKSKAKEEYSTGGTEKLCYAPLEHSKKKNSINVPLEVSFSIFLISSTDP
jgi:hypothetical protein